ncbi:DUF1543 domain-containing protein [Flavobacterium sp. RHBU_24]|uniref:DUF1543 domain-containing protein n=1 Tax=Flavobacterium sp. RHBU_24 TaxID=3391185 RepID=UPI003984AA04
MPTLFMAILGATPLGRSIEQHDVYFGIGKTIKSLRDDMYAFWPNAGQLHIDSWRAVTIVGNYDIKIIPKSEGVPQDEKLFFLNLGGYRPGDLEEYHYKVLVVAKKMSQAIKMAKQTAFYKTCGFKGAESHIDQQYALDVDDIHNVSDLLSPELKEKYHIQITPSAFAIEDELHVGYVKLGPQ